MWLKIVAVCIGIVSLIPDEMVGMSQQQFRLGTQVTQPKTGWNPDVYGHNFFPSDNMVVELDMGEKRAIFFQKDHTRSVSLFVSEHGSQRVLWDGEKITPFSLVPPPALISAKLDANEFPDLFLIYADDCGTGQDSDCWTQEMRLFFDWQAEGGNSVPLSSIDRYLKGKDTENAYDIGEDGGPATARESLVLIFPAFKEESCHILVWSKMTIFDHPPTGTPQTETYRLESYRAGQKQWSAEEAMEGNYQQTAESVRMSIEQWRKQSDAPAPLLLNFSKPNAVLLDDDAWFEYFLREY